MLASGCCEAQVRWGAGITWGDVVGLWVGHVALQWRERNWAPVSPMKANMNHRLRGTSLLPKTSLVTTRTVYIFVSLSYVVRNGPLYHGLSNKEASEQFQASRAPLILMSPNKITTPTPQGSVWLQFSFWRFEPCWSRAIRSRDTAHPESFFLKCCRGDQHYTLWLLIQLMILITRSLP